MGLRGNSCYLKCVRAHVGVHLCVLKQSPVQTGITAKSLCQQSEFTLVISTENRVSNRFLSVRANTAAAALEEAPRFYASDHVRVTESGAFPLQMLGESWELNQHLLPTSTAFLTIPHQ